MVEQAKTPKELHDGAYATEEKRRADQDEFDSKVHGVGTAPVFEPQSVKELFKYMEKRLEQMLRKQGVAGPAGPSGPAGVAGPKGDKGEPGAVAKVA